MFDLILANFLSNLIIICSFKGMGDKQNNIGAKGANHKLQSTMIGGRGGVVLLYDMIQSLYKVVN